VRLSEVVDFKSDGTVTTPSWELLKILALEKRENLMLGLEFYYKHRYDDQGQEQDLNIVRARLWCLYYELEAWLIRAKSEQVIKQVTAKIDSKDKDEVLGVVTFFNKFMDENKLTRIDNIKPIDRTRVELENESDEY
jgi:hypothetical protein